jgi:hypothetical protein
MAEVLKAVLLLWILQVSAQDPEYDHLLVRPRNINGMAWWKHRDLGCEYKLQEPSNVMI